MFRKLRQFRYVVITLVILIDIVSLTSNAYAQEPNSLEWSINTDKDVFYPGEPILLTLNVKNGGTHEETVHVGITSYDGYMPEIRDSSNTIVAKGNKIERYGLSVASPLIKMFPGEMGHKSIVLNRWCSTLLSPGQYHVNCNVEYHLHSENIKKDGRNKVGPVYKTQLAADIQIVPMDRAGYDEVLKNLAAFETQPKAQSKQEWLSKRDIAREMLGFTESELAVPYQLQILRMEQDTWVKEDIINSLVRSGTSEAAIGLVKIIEDPNIYKNDVKPILIDGVYRLRETGKTEIINATDEFIAKNKRPVLAKPID